MERLFCRVEGCGLEGARGDLCWSHKKQQQRHPDRALVPIQPPLNARQRLLEAALAYADAPAESTESYAQRERALYYAARIFGRQRVFCGPRPENANPTEEVTPCLEVTSNI